MGEVDAGARSEKVSSADELLRVRDVQRVLDVSRTMAYKLVSDGVIASVRVGRLVRVRRPAHVTPPYRQRSRRENAATAPAVSAAPRSARHTAAPMAPASLAASA